MMAFSMVFLMGGVAVCCLVVGILAIILGRR